jgi:predicted CXXCH cytochrome family protein
MKLQLNGLKFTQCRWFFQQHGRKLLLSAGGLLSALVLISCVSGNRALIAPPQVEGAKFVGSEACVDCHETITKPFRFAAHANLQAKGTNAVEIGCESCHGAGSVHVDAGGGRGNIVNPRRSPQICFDCHLDKRGEFNLPYHHPVLEGRVSCSDCHDPHKGPGVPQMTSATFAGVDESCAKCHTAQRGPYVFEHEAMREGCTSCHAVHGSVNNKLLTERNQTLCLKCHFQQQNNAGQLLLGGIDHRTFVTRGTCWSAGCHEAVHGSRVNASLRY